jgi:hypothetical protein
MHWELIRANYGAFTYPVPCTYTGATYGACTYLVANLSCDALGANLSCDALGANLS